MFMIGFCEYIWDGLLIILYLARRFIPWDIFLSSLRADVRGYQAWVFVFGFWMIIFHHTFSSFLSPCHDC
jgi:hypothetical protein